MGTAEPSSNLQRLRPPRRAYFIPGISTVSRWRQSPSPRFVPSGTDVSVTSSKQEATRMSPPTHPSEDVEADVPKDEYGIPLPAGSLTQEQIDAQNAEWQAAREAAVAGDPELETLISPEFIAQCQRMNNKRRAITDRKYSRRNSRRLTDRRLDRRVVRATRTARTTTSGRRRASQSRRSSGSSPGGLADSEPSDGSSRPSHGVERPAAHSTADRKAVNR